jgi:hypothetical protein
MVVLVLAFGFVILRLRAFGTPKTRSVYGVSGPKDLLLLL